MLPAAAIGVEAKINAAMRKLFEVIHEDAQLLIINKPAGLVCHPTKTDEFSSLVSRVRLHVGPGIHPHLVNRLDRETSGLTVVAKTDDGARALRRAWESREVRKEYLAIVHGHPAELERVIRAPLGKDLNSKVAIKDCVRADGAAAETAYRVEKSFSARGRSFSLLKLQLLTGRKHQIRIHLAHIGHPIVGDKLYGGDEDLYLALVEDRLTEEQRGRLILPYHALHAGRIEFAWQGAPRTFEAEPEKWFSEFVRASE